jgi:hypothetical protein
VAIRDDPKRHTFQGDASTCSWCVQAPDVHRQPIDFNNADVILCYSRCAWCGRQTPHEWCHQCYADVNAGKRVRSSFHRFGEEPEECDQSDDVCPKARLTR